MPTTDTAADLALECCRTLLEAREGTATLDDACRLAEEALTKEVLEMLARRGQPK